MPSWGAFLFGILVGLLGAYVSLGIYGLALMKRADDES